MGTEQGPGDTQRGPSLPAQLCLCWLSVGQGTWLLQRWSPALPRQFFTFPEHCKTVLVLFREMPAVLSRLSGFFP